MARGFKTGGKNFQKGVVTNPNGRPKLPAETKAIRSLTNEHIKEVMDLLTQEKFDELRALAKDESQPALKLLYARAILRAVETGDLSNIEIVLNRVLGKPKDHVEHSGSLSLESLVLGVNDTRPTKS